MAWPSGSKASTTNVDAGSDKPKLARADIKQNIDNVNAIIDEFDIAAPSNGDILTYNATSGAWEPGAADSGAYPIVTFDFGNPVEITSSDQRCPVTEVLDTNNIASVANTYDFTLPSGTYVVIYPTKSTSMSDNADFTGYDFQSVSGDPTINIFVEITGDINSGVGKTYIMNVEQNHILTLTQSTTFRCVQPASGNGYDFYNVAGPGNMTFMKVT